MAGPWAEDAFRHEAGGHRWQRVSPGDKRGRVHTSTVTVAVLPEPTAMQLTVNPGDLSWAFSRGSGPGGQNRNKTETAVDLTHLPTGLVVHCESERSQGQNKLNALAMLRARLWSAQVEAEHATRGAARRAQLGSGARGDKSWTVRTQDDVVTHHASGQKFRLREYLEGDYEVLR
ncbi:MAG: PCRF domain-containing protein [Myxococcaceae bacterium]|nr:MAG: PCRF domain-containing protein [Myxococcaceae bacterium]